MSPPPKPQEGGPGWGSQLVGLGDRSLVLASASPRRARILLDLGISFETRPVSVPEVFLPEETPTATALRLAEAKARAAAGREDELILGADTVVVSGEIRFGKPRDDREARNMLRALSGRSHRVVTGLALLRTRDGAVFSREETTRVTLCPLGEADIDVLVGSGEATDKAGAYGIQGLAALVVEEIQGDFYNVVGLPVALLRQLLKEEVLS